MKRLENSWIVCGECGKRHPVFMPGHEMDVPERWTCGTCSAMMILVSTEEDETGFALHWTTYTPAEIQRAFDSQKPGQGLGN